MIVPASSTAASRRTRSRPVARSISTTAPYAPDEKTRSDSKRALARIPGSASATSRSVASPPSRAATASHFSLSAPTACTTAEPPIATERLAKVPTPRGTSAESPKRSSTSSRSTPKRSAAICAKVVSWPWPCGRRSAPHQQPAVRQELRVGGLVQPAGALHVHAEAGSDHARFVRDVLRAAPAPPRARGSARSRPSRRSIRAPSHTAAPGSGCAAAARAGRGRARARRRRRCTPRSTRPPAARRRDTGRWGPCWCASRAPPRRRPGRRRRRTSASRSCASGSQWSA